MTAPTTLAHTLELTPLADYISGVLRQVRALPALDVDLNQAYDTVLAQDVWAPAALPAFDHATIDGYAARHDDLLGASVERPVRLHVVGDLSPSSWRPTRVTTGNCYAVVAGAPLPAAADVVVPRSATDAGMATVEVRDRPRLGHGLRRTGEEIQAGGPVAAAGTPVTPALMAVLAATGVSQVVVQPSPRVAVLAIGDELVDVGPGSRAGQVVDATSPALVAAVAEAGGDGFRIGICEDDPRRLKELLDDQIGHADLIVTTGGSGGGGLGGASGGVAGLASGLVGDVCFTEVSLFPCMSLGFGSVGFGLAGSRLAGSGVSGSGLSGSGLSGSGPGGVGSPRRSAVPVVCLPGDPGAALVGFEVLARPVVRRLSGAEPVFRPSVRAHLVEGLASPLGLREFRPAHVSERKGGGYAVRPLPGGPYTLSGLSRANALVVLGERVGAAAPGSTVDVLLLDRRR